jgi:hypothetical protein
MHKGLDNRKQVARPMLKLADENALTLLRMGECGDIDEGHDDPLGLVAAASISGQSNQIMRVLIGSVDAPL